MKTHKFRASYSILSMWASGRWEDAITAYFKLDSFTTRAMQDGKDMHAAWEAEIQIEKRLPAVFGSVPLINPQTEMKKVVSLAPWLDLVFVIDCYDEGDIHEVKSGVQSSQTYATSKQGGIYAVGALLSGMKAKRILIHHHNQYNKESDTSVVWVTEALVRETVEWIETLSAEMHSYLVENGLYERFGK